MKKPLASNLSAKNQRIIFTIGVLYFVLVMGILVSARFAVG